MATTSTSRREARAPLLEGKAAFVTGGASGIGRATARLFAAEGATVAIADVDGALGSATAAALRETGAEAVFVDCDVSRALSVDGAIADALEALGTIDIAVNCAGVIAAPALTADLAEDEWDRMVGVNLKGTWLCMRAEIRQMLRQDAGGVIVNVASTGALRGARTQGAYGATKHGILGLTRTAAIEYLEQGIRIAAVCPGITRTPLADRVFAQADAATIASYEELQRMGRMGEPEEVAEGIAWVASDRASLLIGSPVVLDGGLLA